MKTTFFADGVSVNLGAKISTLHRFQKIDSDYRYTLKLIQFHPQNEKMLYEFKKNQSYEGLLISAPAGDASTMQKTFLPTTH